MNNIDNKNINYRPTPIRHHYKRKRRQKKQGKLHSFILILLLAFGLFYFFQNYSISISESPLNGTISHSPLDLNFNFSPKKQNILLMGVDVASNTTNPFKGNRSDTMLLISIAPYGKNINVISIPRDSKVYIAGKNKTDKINHAFAFGGARLAVKTVEETFGVKINNYIAISNAGVIKMIDTLGGLPIYVEKNMKYDDYTANLHINLQQGNHILSGEQVEGYLRFRHDSYGDIGRIRRQQWFVGALMERIKEPSVIVKLPDLLKIMPEYIQTDLSAYELAKYAGMIKNLDMSAVQVATIPGAPSTKGIVSYWIIDPDKTQELIDRLVYRTKTDYKVKDLSIGISYSENNEEKIHDLKQKFIDNEITDVKLSSSNNITKDYIAIHNLDIAGETIADLKKLIPEIKDIHTIYDPIGVNRVGRDLTIVISKF